MTLPLGTVRLVPDCCAELDLQVLQPAGGRAGRAPGQVGQGDPERRLQHHRVLAPGPFPAGHRLGGHQALVDVVGRHRLAHPDPQAAALEVAGRLGHLQPHHLRHPHRPAEQAAGPGEQPGGQQADDQQHGQQPPLPALAPRAARVLGTRPVVGRGRSCGGAARRQPGRPARHRRPPVQTPGLRPRPAVLGRPPGGRRPGHGGGTRGRLSRGGTAPGGTGPGRPNRAGTVRGGLGGGGPGGGGVGPGGQEGGGAEGLVDPPAAGGADGGREVRGAQVAAGRVGIGGPEHGHVERLGDLAGHPRGRRHPAAEVLLDDLAGVALERRPAADALPGHHPEGVDVGPPVDHPAPQHLGRAVVDGGGKGLPVAALGGRPDQAEVGHLDRLAGQQEVLRLDVEVDHPGVVGVVEGVGHRAEQLGGGLRAQAPLAVEQVTQGPAADVLHHDPGQPPLLARVVDGDHVGVGQPGGRPGLAPELLGEARGRGRTRGGAP